MRYTIELLVRGEPAVVEFYRLARGRWQEIWSRPDSKDLVRLATMLSTEQGWFEKNCGGRSVGQEIMVVTGFGILYSTQAGFDGHVEQARLLSHAFQQSYCSIEVKSMAGELAQSYGLLEEQAA